MSEPMSSPADPMASPNDPVVGPNNPPEPDPDVPSTPAGVADGAGASVGEGLPEEQVDN
jgi:hypothetical protein